MAEHTNGVPNPPERVEDTYLAHGVYRDFFERNRAGITHVDYDTRTYYILRTHTLRGPIPPNTRIEHVGLANSRRSSKIKRRKGR